MYLLFSFWDTERSIMFRKEKIENRSAFSITILEEGGKFCLCHILNESKTTILRINSFRDKAAHAFLDTLFINNMNSMQIYYLHYVAEYSDQHHGHQYYWKTKKGWETLTS